MCAWFSQEVLCVLISEAVHIAQWIGTAQQRLYFSNFNCHQHFSATFLELRIYFHSSPGVVR